MTTRLHHRRAAFHFGGAGRIGRVEVYDGQARCTCSTWREAGVCDHTRHAERLLTEPTRVALERVVELYATTPLDERTPVMHQLYGTAVDALKLDDDRVSHHLAELDRALDPRTPEQRGEDAVAHFQALGPSSGKGYSKADRDVIRRADEAELLAQLKDAGPDTTIIRRP